MSLPRILEPEVMDASDDAREYDSMDHQQVNELFVSDFLAEGGDVEGVVLDLGTGTALIPIELCRRTTACRVLAVDLSIAMLELARYRINVHGQLERIMLQHLDAKQLPFADAVFAAVMSNSIVHHVPDPRPIFAEALRVTRPGGRLFFRDLLRPASLDELQRLVAEYAGDANDYQQRLFRDSLQAALTLAEVRNIAAALGLDPACARQTSDRHWTLSTSV